MHETCRLCEKETKLRNSHLIPSFVGKWIKGTSPTGYLRQVVNANLRRQDLLTFKLLCDDCELMFSRYENEFSKLVFNKYVNKELDDWGVAQGVVKNIIYKEWLLQFIVSLQWRALITSKLDEIQVSDKNKGKFKRSVESALSEWKDYLLGNVTNSGESRHYVIFLQNLAAGRGTLPDNIHPKINTYLLRSVDTTLAYSEQSLFLYTKLGPIVVISGIKPKTLKDMSDSLVHKVGFLKTAQHLENHRINQFVFVDRPKESMNLYTISKKQQSIIEDAIKVGIDKGLGTKSVLVGYSDFMMSKGKRMVR